MEDCREFEKELYKFLDGSKPGILNTLREKKAFDKPLEAELTSAINEVKSRLQANRKVAAKA